MNEEKQQTEDNVNLLSPILEENIIKAGVNLRLLR
jgi:hypothetical protein